MLRDTSAAQTGEINPSPTIRVSVRSDPKIIQAPFIAKGACEVLGRVKTLPYMMMQIIQLYQT